MFSISHLLKKITCVTTNSKDQPCSDSDIYFLHIVQKSQLKIEMCMNVYYKLILTFHTDKNGSHWKKGSMFPLLYENKKTWENQQTKKLHSVSPTRDVNKVRCFHRKHVICTTADPARDANTDCAAHNCQAVHFWGKKKKRTLRNAFNTHTLNIRHKQQDRGKFRKAVSINTIKAPLPFRARVKIFTISDHSTNL